MKREIDISFYCQHIDYNLFFAAILIESLIKLLQDEDNGKGRFA